MSTWARLVASGSGAVGYRLEVEGLPVIFCTDQALRGTQPDGRRRIVGLMREGLSVEESVYLAGPDVDLRPTNASIIETPPPDRDLASYYFTRVPTVVGSLSATVTESATTWQLHSNAALAIGDRAHVGTECVSVLGTGNESLASFPTLTPSAGATVAAAADPDGGTNAATVTDTDATLRYATTSAGIYTSGAALTGSIWLQKDTSSLVFPEIRLGLDATYTANAFAVRLDTGETSVTAGAFSSLTSTEVNGWWLVQFAFAGAVATSVDLRIYPAYGEVASFPTPKASATGSTTVYNPRLAEASTTEITVLRGIWGTQAQAHFVEYGLYASVAELTDVPAALTGRRAKLYGHGSSEAAVGDEGTVLWRKVVGVDPDLDSDGVTWSLYLEPLTKLLDSQIAAGLDEPFRIWGIYYSWRAPFYLQLVEHSGATRDSAVANLSAEIYVTGHYETQAAFAVALQTKIDAATTGWGVAFRVVLEPSTWELEVTIGGTAHYASTTALSGSQVDGGGFGDFLYDGDGRTVEVVSASTRYRCFGASVFTDPERAETARWRTVPRANYATFGAREDPSAEATAPAMRLYLERVGALSTDDVLMIGERNATDAGRETARNELQVDTISEPNGYVDLSSSGAWPPRTLLRNTLFYDNSTIVVTRTYGDGPTDLAGFRDALIAKAPSLANSGTTPWVTSEDLASWTTVVESASAGREYLTRRRYVFTKPQKLIDVLREELKILGCYMCLDADAKITVRQITIPSSTEVAAATIDEDSHVTRTNGDGAAEFGIVSQSLDGYVNNVMLKTGWNHFEAKHYGRSYDVRNIQAISRVKKMYTIDMAPVVEADATVGQLDAIAIANPLLTFYGAKRNAVIVKIPYILWGALIGTPAAVTVRELPYDGARTANTSGSGMVAIRGLIVARRWMLDEPWGELTILLLNQNVAGYSPTARVVSATNTAGNTWAITCEGTRYAPTGYTDASYFRVGDLVRIIEWDAAAPTVLTGTVTIIAANVVTVEFTGVWAGVGGSTWNLFYQPTTAALQAGQLAYADIGDSTRRRQNGDAARVFAP